MGEPCDKKIWWDQMSGAVVGSNESQITYFLYLNKSQLMMKRRCHNILLRPKILYNGNG